MVFQRICMTSLPGRLMFMLVALWTATACDTGEPQVPGTIEGIVTGEGAGLPGVTVELTGAFNRVSETDASGRYVFSEVPPGAYVISIRNLPLDAAFPALSRTAVVASGGTRQVDFQGNFIRTGSISGVIRSRGRGIGGVRVSLSGPDEAIQFSRSDGTFTFPALRAGNYAVEISDFAPSIRFPGTVSEVSLQPGQQHEMLFDGIADLTATVAIERIDQIRADGVRVPADRRQARGTLEVVAVIEPGADTPESVTLFLGDSEVGSQEFSQGDLPLAAGSSAAAALRVTFSVTTDAFDSRTGLPRWANGETSLAVRLATAEGGDRAATAQSQIRLDNRDTFVARLVPAKDPVLGVDGQLWFGGALQVDLLPVLYTTLRGVSYLSVELWGGEGGGKVSGATWTGSGSLRLVFPMEGPGGLAGYVTDRPHGDRLFLVDARDSAGQSFSGLPLTLASGIWLDFSPPSADQFRLPAANPGSGTECCLNQWVGSGFSFLDALSGIRDTGVGGVRVQVHAGPASDSDEALLARPPVLSGRDLPASSGIDAYRAVAVLEDALGNERRIPLQTSEAGETTFGVDRTPPDLTLIQGQGGATDRAINPGPDAFWAFSAKDSVSGLAPLPIRTTLRRWGPGDPPGGQCLRNSGPVPDGACVPEATGLFQATPGPAQGAGYFRLRTQAVDRGGNFSGPIDVWALVDTTPPEVSSIFLVSNTGPGGEWVLGMDLRDDVDLARAHVVLGFAAEQTVGTGATPVRVPAPLAPIPLGTPFSLPVTRERSLEVAVPYWAAIQRAAPESEGGEPVGPLHPASFAEVRVQDAAGFEGVGSRPLPSVSGDGVRTFGPDTRPSAEAVLQWTVSVTPLEPSPEDNPRFRIRATARGDAEAFQSPFEAVHFLAVSGSLGHEVPWLGSVPVGQLQMPDGNAGSRTITWDLDWTAPARWTADDTLEVVALGVDRDGVALLSAPVPLP